MFRIAPVLSIPFAILVALYLVDPRRWRKASVPADALPFRNKAFSALKRAALAWAWGMLVLLLLSAALAELAFPFPFPILGWSVPVAVVLAAVWGVLRPRTYEDRVDRVGNGARIGWLLLVIALPFVYLPVCLFGSALARTGFGGLGLRRDEKPKEYHIAAERYSAAKFAFASPVSERMIPEDATDIIFDFRFGLFGGTMSLGASAELKCKVSREGLEKFAKGINTSSARTRTRRTNARTVPRLIAIGSGQRSKSTIRRTSRRIARAPRRCRTGRSGGSRSWSPSSVRESSSPTTIVTAIAVVIRSSMTWTGRSSTQSGPAIDTDGPGELWRFAI